MHEETLAAIAAQIQQQDAAFAKAKAGIQELGDAEIEIPSTFLEELDDLCTPRTSGLAIPTIHGVRA